MKPKWYIEITWSKTQVPDSEILGDGIPAALGFEPGDWTETDQSCQILRGAAEEVLLWLAAQFTSRNKNPHSFRAIPFDESPVRNIEAYQKL